MMIGAAGASMEEVVGVGGSDAAEGGGVTGGPTSKPADSIVGVGGCSATGDGTLVNARLGCMLDPKRVGTRAGGEASGLLLLWLSVSVAGLALALCARAGERRAGLTAGIGGGGPYPLPGV